MISPSLTKVAVKAKPVVMPKAAAPTKTKASPKRKAAETAKKSPAKATRTSTRSNPRRRTAIPKATKKDSVAKSVKAKDYEVSGKESDWEEEEKVIREVYGVHRVSVKMLHMLNSQIEVDGRGKDDATLVLEVINLVVLKDS